MNFSTLSLLCLPAWSLPLTLSFPPVERRKGLAEISRRSEPPSVPHCEQAFCLTSLHTVILWCTMRCPMILSMIGRPSARASGVCLFREKEESSWICGNPPETNKRTSERAFPLTERGSRLGVHREAGLSLSGSVEIKCLTALRVDCVFSILSARWSQTDKTLWVLKKCVLIL